MSSAFEMRGADKMIATLKSMAARLPRKVGAALYAEANLILTDSKRNYVPFDLGTLMRSGYVEPPVIDQGSASVTIGFGGAAAPYALAIHEHPSEYDPPSWRPREVDIGEARVTVGGEVNFKRGGPKYLEIPLRMAESTLPDNLAKRLKTMGLVVE